MKRVHWLAFALAGGAAGIAGGLFAFAKGSISPETINVGRSIDGIVMVLLGGIESLSGPIAGAGLFEGRHLLHQGITGDVVAGFVTAAIFGLIAIVGLIRFVRTQTYEPFAWYRVILAAFVIIIYLMRR